MDDIQDTLNSIVKIFKEKKSLSSEIINLANIQGNKNNDQYKFFFINY